MFRDFCGFLVATGLLASQVTHLTLLAFMEFLLQNAFTPSNIANYMAGLRASFVLYDLNTVPFQHQRLQYFHKAAKLQTLNFPKPKLHLDEKLLLKIIIACDDLQFPVIFKPLYLLAFFSFLRISNILPHAITSFDPTRQLAVGDIIFSHNAATIIIKWSKTLQDKSKIHTIPLPFLGDSPLCPIQALQHMLSLMPGDSNVPLFRIPRSHGLVPVTDSVARRHLKAVSDILHLHTSLKFHDFRRAGATWAFNHGVPMKDIMLHGTWKSDAVWAYIQSIPLVQSPVSATFKHHLSL